jgi:hypothetical protein
MNQTIVFEYPPIFDRILEVFPKAKEPGVLFAFGDRIFNPSKAVIPAELLEHENVHGVRQIQMLGGVTEWWEQYLDSPKFRLAEEVQAHWAEYHVLATLGNRHDRKAALKQTAIRLASPLYGRMIGPNRARELLLEVEREYKRLARNNNPMFFDEESTDVDQ